MKLNIPLALTLARLILSPFLLPIMIVYLVPTDLMAVKYCLAIVFVLFNATDFLDGYLARKLGQVTKLGALLDPIADKALLFSVLIALVATGKLYFYWAILLIGREFFVMGLRLIALENNVTISVSSFGKLKTVLVTAYITILLLNPHSSSLFTAWGFLELLLFSLAVGSSLWSAYQYALVFKEQCFSKVELC